VVMWLAHLCVAQRNVLHNNRRKEYVTTNIQIACRTT